MTPLLRPMMRSWAASMTAEAGPRPMPSGDPVVVVDGADPDRVLVIGSGPAAGAGAPDHAAALPGTLARALSARTGRGAVVEGRGVHRARLRDLSAMIDGAQLQRFDALVVCIGLEDGVTGVSVRRWRRGLTAFVHDLRQRGARDATIVLTRIPPASAVRTYRGAPVLLADLDIRRLNRAIDAVARGQERVLVAAAPMPGPDAPVGSAAWYERCGTALAGELHARFAGRPA